MIEYSFRSKNQWWIRIFGYGIAYKNTDKHRLLFSERNKIVPTVKIGKHFFKYLKKIQ